MQELFPGRKTRPDLSWRGWDVGSSCDSAARLANPILNLPKTSGPLNARLELFVQLARVSLTQRGSFLRREIPCSRATTQLPTFPGVDGTYVEGPNGPIMGEAADMGRTFGIVRNSA
jgi:hypothetical protein